MHRLVVRIDQDDAPVAVDDDRVAAVGNLGQVLQRHDGRDAERPGDDRRVTGSPTGVGSDALDELPVEAGRLRRAQLPRHDDHFLAQTFEVLPLASEQLPEKASFDIVDIGGALAHVRIGEVLKAGGDLPQHGGDGVLGADRLGMDQVRDLPAQRAVPQKTQVHGKDVLDAPATRAVGRLLQLGQFEDGVPKGVAHALDLRDPLRRLNAPSRDPVIFGVDDQALADRDPG